MIKLQGYVTSKSFNGYAIPVPIQNKLLRYYTVEQNMMYVLPQCELFINNNYMALFDTLRNMQLNSHIGLCSVFMLPLDESKLKKVIDMMVSKNITSHFIFENKTTSSSDLLSFFYEKNIANIIKFQNKEKIKDMFI